MTKVCFFIPSFGGGGAERQCVYLVNALSLRPDFEVCVVYFHKGVNFDLLESRVEKIQVETKSNYDPRNLFRVKQIFVREQPEIVFSWLHASDVYAWGAHALGGRFKWIMAERDSWYPNDPRFLLRRLVGSKADMIISNSIQGDLYWAERGVPKGRRAVVQNILADDWFVEADEIVNRDFICYAGRLEHQKNVLVLVEAFLQLANRRSDAKCIVVGQGSLKDSLAKLIADAATGSVSLRSYQPRIRDTFDRTAVFVNLSHHEGKPNTVIENLALGNRVVLSRIPEHIELVGPEYAFLVDTDASSEAIACTLERALDTPVSCHEKQHNRARLQTMRVEHVVDSYIDIFNKVMGY